MLWLALVLFVSITIALLRGGRIANFADIELRGWWLLLIGFGLQAGAEFIPSTETWSRSVGVGMVLLSFIPLLAVVILNRNKPGMWLVGVGILMNLTVIAANGGMPVMEEAVRVAASYQGEVVISNYKHVVMGADTWFPFLGDVMPLRLLGVGQVISLGDVFLAVGLGRFLESELRRPVRWFKHGAHGESGSAVRR